MTTSADGEWMSAHEALEFLTSRGVSAPEAKSTVRSRAQEGLVKARATLFKKRDERWSDVDLPSDFWGQHDFTETFTEKWGAGDFQWSTFDVPLRQAFGVTFRRADVEQLKPARQQDPAISAARRAPINDRAVAWISAAEAIKLLSFGGGRTICAHAKAGLVVARAKLYIVAGQRQSIVNVPAEFWWAEGGEALQQDWSSGHFVTWIKRDTVKLEAFGVEFGYKTLSN